MNSPSRPVTVLTKSDVLDGLFAVWDDIETLLGDLPDSQWTTATSLPGWNVQDVVSHMIGTESFLEQLPSPESDIDVSTLEHVRNPIGVMNEQWVRGLRHYSPAEMLDRFRSITERRRAALTAMSDDEWMQVTATPAGPDSYARFMRVRVFDCWMHEHDIREAVGAPLPAAELDSPGTQLALDEMTASMGFVVGKRAGAPEGARVVLELTGPLARTINVEVAGRAKVVESFGDAEPTTTITVDGLLFTRLAGGRTTAAEHPDEIAYGGDAAVGRRIVEHLDYVI
ncbi:maleylpyruvate isomerase family mycothiol-dependent enzyme [Mycolicibacterium xanthum]|uniref:maleylpyruvate isomerase family mycothiol-dependent enzyme n=1 Tax=Mycolicibacterium xanthum TaxID=2796469 RepID=UPI0027E0FDFD|nr:maleylpyruvate isomerase family mycothiol-dependent enzyme [Mycolicibacterium xanthum]